MLDFTALGTEINRLQTVRESNRLLLERLFADFEAHKNDPAAIQALVDQARTEIDGLNNDVLAHTPADAVERKGKG